MTPLEEMRASFVKMIKSIPCPNCGLEYTDYAVEWGEAWSEGRRDCMDETGFSERDGPYKVKCELCGSKALINYFTETAALTDPKSE